MIPYETALDDHGASSTYTLASDAHPKQKHGGEFYLAFHGTRAESRVQLNPLVVDNSQQVRSNGTLLIS